MDKDILETPESFSGGLLLPNTSKKSPEALEGGEGKC